MDTFDLVEILVNDSSFSRGKLVSLLKKYPLNKFTTEKLLVEILNEKVVNLLVIQKTLSFIYLTNQKIEN